MLNSLFNSENPDSIILNAFTCLIIPSVCNQSPIATASTHICKDHQLTLPGLSSPPLGHCQYQTLIPHGQPPYLAQALTYLSAAIAASLPSAQTPTHLTWAPIP